MKQNVSKENLTYEIILLRKRYQLLYYLLLLIFFTGFFIGEKVAYKDVELLKRNRKEIIQDMKTDLCQK